MRIKTLTRPSIQWVSMPLRGALIDGAMIRHCKTAGYAGIRDAWTLDIRLAFESVVVVGRRVWERTPILRSRPWRVIPVDQLPRHVPISEASTTERRLVAGVSAVA